MRSVGARSVGLTDGLCGSGACAAAHVLHACNLVGGVVEVRMPGGAATVSRSGSTVRLDRNGDLRGFPLRWTTGTPTIVGNFWQRGAWRVGGADWRHLERGGGPLELGFEPMEPLEPHGVRATTRTRNRTAGAFGEFGGESTGLIDRSFRERIVLAGVTLGRSDPEATDASMDELARLVETAGADPVARVLQQRDSLRTVRPTCGKGQGRWRSRTVSEALDADTVVFDNDLTPAQQGNLEEILKRSALDRTAVILDIFAQNASSPEGRAQVELAQLRYRLPRLRHSGQVPSASRPVESAPGAPARPSWRWIAVVSCDGSPDWSPT